MRDMVRAVLEQALAERRCVRLVYAGAGKRKLTRREVEPRALEDAVDRTYLRAYCRWRKSERTFRLDRIHNLELLDERFDDRGDGSRESAVGSREQEVLGRADDGDAEQSTKR